jgi:hypothetical protein
MSEIITSNNPKYHCGERELLPVYDNGTLIGCLGICNLIRQQNPNIDLTCPINTPAVDCPRWQQEHTGKIPL